jgi:hypothetical protein
MRENEHLEAPADEDARPEASEQGGIGIDAAGQTAVEQARPAEVRSAGDARVDEALKPLRALDDAHVHDHPAVIEDVHRTLQNILAEERD